MPEHDKRKKRADKPGKKTNAREEAMSNLMQRHRKAVAGEYVRDKREERKREDMLRKKRNRGRPPVGKLKTKSAKEAAEGLGGKKEKRDIILRRGGKALTPGKKKKPSIGEKLKQASISAKKKDAFSGVMSPESVEKRKGNRIRKVEARQAKNEAQTKKILSRKQKQAARKGRAGQIERLEEVKGRLGN